MKSRDFVDTETHHFVDSESQYFHTGSPDVRYQQTLFSKLTAYRPIRSVASDWTLIQVDGNAFDRQQMYDNLQLGEPVALSVVELLPESVKEFKLFLHEFSAALDAGVIATVEVTGERKVIGEILKSEEIDSIAE